MRNIWKIFIGDLKKIKKMENLHRRPEENQKKCHCMDCYSGT